MRRWLISALLCLLSGWSLAQTARPVAEDPVLEARMMALATELRCLVCQNQTIADSHAELAIDLRQQIRDQLRQGRDETQIRAFMTDRYGDFVLYRPPVSERTALLWFGPGVLLVLGLASLILILRRRSRLGAEAFDPDEADDPARTP
ncbi:MAG: cytochrome c-type biogenesis protein CcmH [Vitreoscilla sp.]|nr:cytochrome c-type biogenesis protein CcmH [Vitreoscilla sp.]